MRRLLYVQHAQSQHRVRGLTGGSTDTPVTELGRAQAEQAAQEVAQRLRGEPARLFSSDLARARQTAEPIAVHTGLALQLEPGLRELHNGDAAGLTLEEAREVELPRTEPALDWRPYPGAETWLEMRERVFACLTRIEATTGETCVVVSHGHAGIALVCWWLRLDERASQGVAFQFDSACITELALNVVGRTHRGPSQRHAAPGPPHPEEGMRDDGYLRQRPL